MNSIKKNYIFNTSYQILLLIIPLITTPYIARVLGADLVGKYSYQYTIASYFVTFIMLGLENYGNRAIAENKTSNENLKQVFSSIFFLQFFSGIIMTAIYIIYATFMASNKLLSAIFIINVIGASFNVSWLLYGLEKFKEISVGTAIIKILSTCSIFLLVRTKENFVAYCIIMVISTFITNAYMMIIAVRKVGLIIPKPNQVFSHFVPNAKLFLTVISVTMCKTIDKLMLGIFDPTKVELGYYELSERIVNIPMILVVSIGTVMMPRITYIISQKEEGEEKLTLYSIFFSALIVSSMTFGIMAVSPEFVMLYYGKGYEPCVLLYIILLPASIFMAFANVIRTQILLPRHMDGKVILSGYLALGINVITNTILIPKYGANGAAVATVFAEIVCCIVQSYSVKKIVSLSIYIRVFMSQVCIGLIMMAAIFWITNLQLPLFVGMVIKIMLGFLIYMILLFLYMLIVSRYGNEREQDLIRWLLAKIQPYKRKIKSVFGK